MYVPSVFFLWTKHVHTITMCRQVSWPQFCYLFSSEFVQNHCFVFYSTLDGDNYWVGFINTINYGTKSVEKAQNLVFNSYSNIKLFLAFKHLCSLFLYYFFQTYITCSQIPSSYSKKLLNIVHMIYGFLFDRNWNTQLRCHN